jgi:hypothetical protein
MRLLLVFAALFLLINTASAYQQADLGRVKQANFNAPQGYVIFSIYANDIAFSDDWSIQTFNLNAFGQNYVLTVMARAEGWFGAWKHFVVNLTYPNGTTASQEITYFGGVFNDYDIKIQYYAAEPDVEGAIPTGFGGLLQNRVELDVYIYLNPLQARTTGPLSYDLGNFLLFNQVVFSSTDEAHLEVYYCTVEEWQDIVQNPLDISNLLNNTKNLIGEAGEWIKEQVKKIPYGGLLVTTFDTLYFLLSGSLYYMKLIFIDNALLTFSLFEAFALAWSAGTSRDFFVFLRKYVRVHKSLFEFLLGMVQSIIDIISKVIQALKPV